MRFNKTWECFSLVKDLPVLSLVKDPSRPNAGRREKINLKFYFHTSLWCLKRFYEGFKGFSIQLSVMHGMGRVLNSP